MEDNTTLQRYEFKYFLKKKLSDEIVNQVKKFMNIDTYADSTPNKKYFVRSVYFEDDFNSNFDEKVDGHRIRKKFRFRHYKKNLDSGPIYLETKGRNLERTYKRRIKIEKKDIELIKDPKNLYKLVEKYPNSRTVNEFVFESYKKNLKPKVIVDYERQPYVNKHGLYFRLTFDQNISCINLNDHLENYNKNNIISCKSGFTILEVKFDRSIPLWFHRIIQSYNLRRQSISKFVLGMCYSRLGRETSD
jgi:hypothetical protein